MSHRRISVVIASVLFFLLALNSSFAVASSASGQSAIPTSQQVVDLRPSAVESTDGNNAPLPILMMHGINGNNHDFDLMKVLLEKKYPGVLAIPLDVNNNLQSFIPLPLQLMRLQDLIIDLQKKHNFKDFHLVCHSQGGLLGRALAASWAGHSIQKLVILSSPLVGQYGVPPAPFLPDPLKHITRTEAYRLLYTHVMQETFSVANMWKDPLQHGQYLDSNQFLTRLYNESTAAADIQRSYQFKATFLKVKHVHLFASPADEVIIPWQSALLGFYKVGSATDMINMEDQLFYKHDYCGFNTLVRQNRLSKTIVPGVPHVEWVRNAQIINKYVLPVFDM